MLGGNTCQNFTLRRKVEDVYFEKWKSTRARVCVGKCDVTCALMLNKVFNVEELAGYYVFNFKAERANGLNISRNMYSSR